MLVGAGSRHETPETNGLSHFLEHMLFRGTDRYPSAYELNRSVEELGGILLGATHVDSTLLSVTVPPENLCGAVEILAEILRAPAFTAIETEKRIAQEEILEGLDEDGVDVDVDNVSRALLFSPHPLGFKITGSADNIDRFDVEDLRDHMRAYYGGRNSVLCVAGALEPDRVFAAVRDSFRALPPGERASVQAPALAGEGRRFAYVPHQGSQTDVRVCFPTFGERDPRFIPLKILSRILDDGMSTRVHRRICDEMGLAYDAFAGADLYEDCGVFDLGAAAEHGKAPVVLEELLRLVRELRDAPVHPAELQKAQRRHAWDLSMSLDDDEAMALFYGTNALFGYEDTLESLAERATAVTAEQVLALAREIFRPEVLHVACVGVLDGAQVRATRDVFERYE